LRLGFADGNIRVGGDIYELAIAEAYLETGSTTALRLYELRKAETEKARGYAV
jgi:hypothetical protein